MEALVLPCGSLSSPAIWKRNAKSSLHDGTFRCSPSPYSKFEVNLKLYAIWLHGNVEICVHEKMCNSTFGLLWLLKKRSLIFLTA